MSDQNDTKLNGAPVNGTARPEPFRRQVTWGRPPQTVFRTGPLPRAKAPDSLAAPVAPTRPSSILSGSMIPRAAPAATPKSAAPPPAPATETMVPGPADVSDLVVRPLPEPELEPTATAVPSPTPLLPPEPDILPDVVVVGPPHDAVEARTPAEQGTRGKSSGRLPLYAGAAVAVLAIAAAGWWLVDRTAQPATTVPPVTEPLTVPALATSVDPVVPDVAPVEMPAAEPAPEPVTPAVNAAAAPAQARPTATPALVVPSPQPRPVSVPPPAIETQPLTGPTPVASAPTAAERPVADPDAPITTRPQPLD